MLYTTGKTGMFIHTSKRVTLPRTADHLEVPERFHTPAIPRSASFSRILQPPLLVVGTMASGV